MAMRVINGNTSSVFTRDDPFNEEEQSRPHYYPTPEKYLDSQTRQISIKPLRIDNKEEDLGLISKSFVDQSHTLRPIPNQQVPLYDEEIWPTTSSDQSMTMSTPELSSNQKRDNQITSANIKDGNEDSKQTDIRQFNRSFNELKAVASSRELNQDRIRSDATTVSWYIDRFRQSKPTPRDDRYQSTPPSKFWWKDDKDKAEIDRSIHGVSLEHEINDKFSDHEGNINSGSSTKDTHSEKKNDPLNDLHHRASLLISESQSALSESSLVPRVSSDGFSSDFSDRKNDYYQPTSGSKTVPKQASRHPDLRLMKSAGTKKKADETIVAEDINFARGGDGDDLLYQWRIARKMELARLSRARSGFLNVHTQFIPRTTSNLGSSNGKSLNVNDAAAKPQYKNASIQTTAYFDHKSLPKIDTLNVSTQTEDNSNLIIPINNHAINNKKEAIINKSPDQASITTINTSNRNREGSPRRNNTDVSVDVDSQNYQFNNVSSNFINTPIGVRNIREGQSVQENMINENPGKSTFEDEKYIPKEKLKDYEIDLDSLSSDEEYEDEILQILECKASLCRQQLARIDVMIEELRKVKQSQDSQEEF